MHPVGPQSSRVYWIRRAGLVVAAVLVLIGMVWFLANRNSSSARQQSDATVLGQSGSAVPTLTGELAASSVSALPSVLPSASAPASPSASPSASADASPSASPTEPSASAPAASPSPSASVEATAASGSAGPATPASPTDPAPAPTPEPTPAAPPPSYDPQGRLLCADADIAVAAGTSEPTFTAGQQPRLTVSVTNKGSQPCVRDLSGPLQIFTVFAADGTRVWSTADCFPGQGSDVRELAAGQAVTFTIKWSGMASAPGCTGDRLPVPPGDYTLVAQLGGLSSPPVSIAVTG